MPYVQRRKGVGVKAPVAQMEEQLTRNEPVARSIRAGSTKTPAAPYDWRKYVEPGTVEFVCVPGTFPAKGSYE